MIMLECDEVYGKLRRSLAEYAREFKSRDIEDFADDMEFWPETRDSIDPAHLDEFSKLCQGRVSLSEAFAIAAEFVLSEVVTLWNIPLANTIVNDFRAAAQAPEAASPILRRCWF